jgi:hypothetical protein
MDSEDQAEAYRFRKRLLNGLGSAERSLEGSANEKEVKNVWKLIAKTEPLEPRLVKRMIDEFPEAQTGAEDTQSRAAGQTR